MQTTSSGIAELISEEHASTISQMIEENTEVEISQSKDMEPKQDVS